MATSNLETHKSLFLLLSVYISLFLLFLNKVNSAESVSFSFTKFIPDQENLILQGDALVRPTGRLELTRVDSGEPASRSLGRALYASPVRIYDNTTGELASFVTSFSFVIQAPLISNAADGLAFFLAPVNSQPQRPGGYLGLFNDMNFNRSNPCVAIEFDTFINTQWDPQDRHIGINVNSIRSIKTEPFSLANGQVANVIISYVASTKTLTASVVYPSQQSSFIISSNVDLREVLPEFVNVGFSATTGLSDTYIETHDILSWSFVSKLPDCDALKINDAGNMFRDSM